MILQLALIRSENKHVKSEGIAVEVGHDVMRVRVARVVEHDEKVLLRVLTSVGGKTVLVQGDHIVR